MMTHIAIYYYSAQKQYSIYHHKHSRSLNQPNAIYWADNDELMQETVTICTIQIQFLLRR